MNRAHWERRLEHLWYGRSRAYIALWPLSCLYCAAVRLRRFAYRVGLRPVSRLDSKVVVVGNLTVGGTGKTPLVIALSRRLRSAGLEVGILTRGYRGSATRWPQQVDAGSDPGEVGDESVLLARRGGAPVFAGPDRVAAGQALLRLSACDVVICDDGLQHYALYRDLEVALTDSARGHGNGLCLPAGPLREPVSRLNAVDAVVSVGGQGAGCYTMRLVPGAAHRLSNPVETRSLASFGGGTVHAVAGIADPERFFQTLRGAGLEIETHRFADHHPFRPSDLDFGDQRPVLMTEKDAVKCESFARAYWWSVAVEALVDQAFEDWLLESLN